MFNCPPSVGLPDNQVHGEETPDPTSGRRAAAKQKMNGAVLTFRLAQNFVTLSQGRARHAAGGFSTPQPN